MADPDRDLGVNRRVNPFKRWYTRLDRLPERWRQDAHVFFGVALRQKGSSEPVLWPALWADLDQARDLPSDLPPPTAVVGSGAGRHLYWRLRVPIRDRIEAHRRLRALAQRIGADERAAEPTRLLRVPGTVNVKYSPPRPCQLIELHPERVYDLADFPDLEDFVSHPRAPADPIEPVPLSWEEAAPHLSATIRRLAWSGTDEEIRRTLKGDASGSELDWAIVSQLAEAGFSKEQILGFYLSNPQMAASARMRHGGRGPRVRDDLKYLFSTIHEAFARLKDRKEAAAQADRLGLTVVDGCLARVGAGGQKRIIADFTAEPLSIVEGVGGGLEVRLRRQDGHERIVFLDARSLSNRTSFRQAIGSTFVWRGQDHDLTALHEYLLRMKPSLPIRQGTRLLGWHGDVLVTSNGVWDQTGLVESPRLVYRGTERWVLEETPNWRERATEVLRLLVQLHEPAVVWAVLGWTMTTFFAPRLRAARGGNPSEAGEFSGLWLWGEPGGGKSRTLAQFLRLTASPFLNLSGDTTVAGLQSVVSASNCSPVFIDDPRRLHRRGRESDVTFQDVLHHAFGGSPVRKGTPDLSGSVIQPMLAPCVGTSELPVERDPAFTERYLLIPVRKSYLSRNPRTADVLERLFDLPIEQLALGFFRYIWTLDVPSAWRRALALTSGLRAAPDRMRKSIAQILLGLQVAQEIAELDYGASYAEIASTLWETAYRDRGYDPGSGQSERLQDLIELWWNLIAERVAREGQDFRVVGDAMYIPLFRFLRLVEWHSRNDVLPFTRSSVLHLIRSHTGGVVQGVVRVQFPGGDVNRPECLVLNLNEVERMGLTARPWLSMYMGGE